MTPTKKKQHHDKAIRLVRLVKKNPCLYNYNLPEYSQKESHDNAWAAIGRELKSDPKDLREKWRNYRTVFMRRWKRDSLGTPNKTNYYLMDELKFLLDYVKVSVPFQDTTTASHASTRKNSKPIIVHQIESSSSGGDNKHQQVYTIEKTDLDMFQEKLDEDEYMTDGNAFSGVTEHVISNSHSGMQHSYTSVIAAPTEIQIPAPGDRNPRRLFLMSIAPELEKLDDKKFRRFRKLCLDFLDDDHN